MIKTKRVIVLAFFILSAVASLSVMYHIYQLPTEQKRTITLCTYQLTGEYDYIAKLKPNEIYKKSTLKPGEGTLYTRIIEYINITFSYTFESQLPANITITHNINEYLEASGWKITLNSTVPQNTLSFTGKIGEFSTNHSVDITSIKELVDAIDQEIGTRSTLFDLTITPEIRTVAYTDAGPIGEFFTPTLTINFNYGSAQGDYISIQGLEQIRADALKQTQLVKVTPANQKILPYVLCTLAFFLSMIGFGLTHLIRMPTKTKPVKPEKPIEEIIAPYKEIIVETVKEPSYKGQITIRMKTLEDLVRAADGLVKPVLRSERAPSAPGENPTHIFYVFDGLMKYEYTITAPSRVEKKPKLKLPWKRK